MLNREEPTHLLAEAILMGKPRPHYLVGEVLVSPDNLSLEATAVFPSSDPSIGDRGHVNVSHCLFAIWNSAHVLADVNGLQNTLSLEGKWKVHKILKPDQPMKLHIEIVDASVHKRSVKGSLEATYTMDEEVYAIFSSSFIARKKIQPFTS